MPEANLQPSTEGVCLTISLIVQRNMPVPVKKEDPEKISEALTSIQVLRLDRERISCITNLPEFKHVHSIYLQQNQIKKIENLNCFPNLKFLSLSGNYINKVESLQPLLKLKFLDLSQNCIDTLDIDELPLNLAILDLTGNKCMNQKGYRESVLAALPNLIELDHKGIPKQKVILQNNEEEENSSEESDYEDCPELFQPLSTEKDFFVDLHNEFSSRSTRRRETAMREHEVRLEELRQRQNLRQLVFNTSESRTEPLSLLESTSPVLNDLPQTANHLVLNPPQRTENPTVDAGLNIPKEKNEGAIQTQQKIAKGKVSSAAKTANKNIKK
ncbi:PREDICTED: leucine-rich repeat-containing protein 46 [Thamnophis sirtalis]|uniref:Leucine-rich repeat-containing protein 46 n=1 Tax=Thamnophis sirtalis TaxID=35019 RepID=A0A6I9XD80_9SAUR|nr:PREDICTED: leucine-rich repeat-containing protein 46 [Thamnophis sirtalis]XP_013913569.1 PREDICTED: leucine-rich repeat-containing protein 46 [Thamnophis sirtalis]